MNEPSQPGAIAPWLLITFIIVLLAGGGYLGWWYYSTHKTTTPTPTATTTAPTTTTPATTSTADWKTYTNDVYKFSFKYPQTFRIGQDTIQDAGEKGGTQNALQIEDSQGQYLSIWVNPDGFGAEGAKDYYHADIIEGKIVISSKGQEETGGGTYISINVMEYNNNGYMLFYGYQNDRGTAIKTFDQILSTFQLAK